MCRACLSRRGFLGRGLGAAVGLAAGATPMALAAREPTPGVAGAVLAPQTPASRRSSHLELAWEAWRWIRTGEVATDHGVTWLADPTDSESVGDTLYSHGTGVLPFALELFHATQDQEVLQAARNGADHLAATLDDVSGAGLYVGLGGVAFVLEEAHRATGEARYRDAAAAATDLILDRAEALGSGVAWPQAGGDGSSVENNDIVSGTSGTILTLLYLAERQGREDALVTARQAGQRLLDKQIEMGAGLRWDIYDGYAREMPNFSHGTAGVAYALATLSEATGEASFLDAALAGARYLTSIATVSDEGYLIKHNAPEGEDLFYLSWCHGPVGTNRLFHRLAERTGDPTWRDWVRRGARGIMTTGVPEQRTPGFWENVSQCGGSAGLGDYFLTLYRLEGRAEDRAFVDRLNADLLKRSTAVRDGRKWTQSEHRVLPDLLVAQTGYMQGAAGIGKYYLHLHGMEESGAPPAIILPDAPY